MISSFMHYNTFLMKSKNKGELKVHGDDIISIKVLDLSFIHKKKL